MAILSWLGIVHMDLDKGHVQDGGLMWVDRSARSESPCSESKISTLCSVLILHKLWTYNGSVTPLGNKQ